MAFDPGEIPRAAKISLIIVRMAVIVGSNIAAKETFLRTNKVVSQACDRLLFETAMPVFCISPADNCGCVGLPDCGVSPVFGATGLFVSVTPVVLITTGAVSGKGLISAIYFCIPGKTPIMIGAWPESPSIKKPTIQSPNRGAENDFELLIGYIG